VRVIDAGLLLSGSALTAGRFVTMPVAGRTIALAVE
jgi:hypothetical protein